jgi:hypothetical protein
MLSGISFLQGYVLTEHLNIPRSQQGTVSGDLSFWVEVVALLLFTPVGVLADRIGRGSWIWASPVRDEYSRIAALPSGDCHRHGRGRRHTGDTDQ